MNTPNNTILPPKSQERADNKERQYRTALSADNYLKLEKEALSRGITPYKLTSYIMGFYLSGECVLLSDLPKKPADQIRAFMAQPEATRNAAIFSEGSKDV